MAKPDILITLPRRGLKIVPPENISSKVRRARNGEKIRWDEGERTQLQLITSCFTLEQRYPTAEEGARLMNHVDYERWSFLMNLSRTFSDGVLQAWNTIQPDSPIALLIYGSVARGLVKGKDHPKPSDIDLLAVGEFTNTNTWDLRNEIRGLQMAISRKILAGCNPKDLDRKCYADLNILNISNAEAHGYFSAKRFIQACATPLYDPNNIWKNLQSKALGDVHQAPQNFTIHQTASEVFL